MSNEIWFRRKRIGWGWTPWSWEGWTCVVVYSFATAAPRIFNFFDVLGPLGFAGYVVLLTIFLIALCYIKGERTRR